MTTRRIQFWAAPFPSMALLALTLNLMAQEQPRPLPLLLDDEDVPNIARPELHPYADPMQGRDGYSLADQPVNEFRLYDFYSRQADYYLEQDELPPIIPAYPGMEAGIFGHWGKYSQFHLSNDRWSRMDFGAVLGGVIRPQDRILTKAVVVSLGDAAVSTCFDPMTLSYPCVWSDGFIILGTRRWGMMSNLGLKGEIQFMADAGTSWSLDGDWAETNDHDSASYQGYYRYGDDIVFAYQLGKTRVLDAPGAAQAASGHVFTRTLHFGGGLDTMRMKLFQLPTSAAMELEKNDGALSLAIYESDGRHFGFAAKTIATQATTSIGLAEAGYAFVDFSKVTAGSLIRIYSWVGTGSSSEFESFAGNDSVADPGEKIQGGPLRWPETFTLPGSLSHDSGPYVVDTLPVPLENPYRSMMFLSGLSFFKNGDAAVATFFGDVWLVSGITETLESVTWKRFATGLNQPLGLDVIDDRIYALCKDQITILHDLNEDGEADFYENFCNRFVTSPGGHDYNTGFQRDGNGNFYFATKHQGIYQVSPDGKEVRVLATGLRNPNGIGVSPDGTVVTSPQQGQWAPASMIIEAHEGEFYGYPKDRVDKPIAPPLCYVPRGVDNSTGGQLFVTSDRWGPLKDRFLSFSFGDCSHYLVLRDADGGRPQGAVVPLKGEFLSGAHRARFHPIDRQLYVIGSQGWGNYATKDGSFQRVRYTGTPVYYPIGFKVHENGIRIDFPRPLASGAMDAERDFFCQQWNYQYSKGYGSPEYSVRYPQKLGHDYLSIRSAHVIGDGSSLFLEIPEIAPVMQLQVRMHLTFEDGQRFSTDLFSSIIRLGDAFVDFPNAAPPIKDKPDRLTLRILDIEPPKPIPDGEVQPGREIVIKAITGLMYDKTFIKVKAGERISLTLDNTDVMPHNWVLVGFEGYTRVGEASMHMVSDPLAFQNHFVPESRDVIVHTTVVNPGQKETIHFNAPTAAGDYPFLCTYPGHWQLMRGTMIVY